MDETTVAYETPQARPTVTHVAGLPDRISVRDYTRSVEIGAFRTERGVTQRIRFNVALEVSHHDASRNDDVDKVISYDTIVDAIEAELGTERINLLETLAERLAARCLEDPRAIRVFVRLEKLDRIPGSLGVEIARARSDIDIATEATARSRARVVYLPAKAIEGALAEAWLGAVIGLRPPLVICVGTENPPERAVSEVARRIGLLSIDQAAWAISERLPGFGVFGSRTELDWAVKTGRPSVWAPTKMVMDAKLRPDADASRPDLLAAWLAGEIRAELFVTAGDDAPDVALCVGTPAELRNIG